MTDEIVEHPEGIRVMKNGAWQDKETGKIVRGAPMSSDEARELAKRRKQLTARAQRDSLIRSMGLEPAEDEEANDVIFAQAVAKAESLLWKAFTEEQGSLKHRLDVYKSLRELEGTSQVDRAEPMEGAGLTINFAPEVVEQMVKLIQANRND